MKDQTGGSTRGRRNHDQGFKDDLVVQSLVAGASVSAIAIKGGINANLLFKWRQECVFQIIVDGISRVSGWPRHLDSFRSS